MSRIRAGILLLATVATPALAQSVERDLPADRPLEMALWGADVQVVLRPGATPHLVARAVVVQDGSGEAVAADGPAVDLRQDGGLLRVVRINESEAVRLRVEVTLDIAHPVKITGRDLDVTVEAPPLDFRKMAARRLTAAERGEEPPAPTWTDVSLQVESSRADLSGLSGGVLQGRDSWFIVRQSANRLTVELEGGAAELTQHRGELKLDGSGGEIELRDAMGEIDFRLEGTRLAIVSAEGKLEGLARSGATVQLDDWGGHAEIESFDSVLELRAFRPGEPMLGVVADDSEVTVEAMASGRLAVDVKGGRLRVRDVSGKMKLTASDDADVELERLKGTWQGTFEGCTIVAREIERLNVELTDADLRLDGAEDLRLTATGSEIVVSGVRSVSQAFLTGTRAELDLSEGARAQIETRGMSRVFVGMRAPCFVLTPSPRKGDDAAAEPRGETLTGLDVTGCTVGADIGRDVGDGDGERAAPSFLTLTMNDESELDVRGL